MRKDSLILIYPGSAWGGSKEDYRFTTGIPLPLLYLAGAVRDICPDIHLFDFNLKGNDDAALISLVDAVQPFAIGINCMFSGNFPEVRRLSSRIKDEYPEIKIILGGIHPTIYAKEIMDNCAYVDAICLAESDGSFPALLEYYKNAGTTGALGKSPHLPQIDGLALRLGEDVFFSEKKNYITNLDALPMPGYEYVDFSRYRINTSGMFNPRGLKISDVLMRLLTSRSCPNQCKFCAMRLVMGNHFRMRSPANVFEEIKHLYDNYGINYFEVNDDSFTFNRRRALEICNLIIKNKLDIYLSFRSGLMIRTLDDEVIHALCEAGGIRFNLAIESGNDFIRNTMLRKNCSREKIFDTVSALRKYDVQVNAFFMIGFPEDTEETLQDTLQMINELDIDTIHLSKVNPLPGTALFAQCLEDNLFTDIFDVHALWNGEHAMVRSPLDGGGGGGFFIRPYNLSLDKLVEYDDAINKVIKQRMVKLALRQLRKKGIATGNEKHS